MQRRLTVDEAIPHVGVGPVKLGMTREEVHRVMPGPRESFHKDSNDEYETQMPSTTADSRSSTVVRGLSWSISSCPREASFRVLYRGVDVFATPADQVLAHVSGDAAFDPTDPELGYAYIFPDLDLSLWRPVLPETPEDPEGREVFDHRCWCSRLLRRPSLIHNLLHVRSH